MSNPDDPDRKPPPQRTVAWDPADVPGMSDEPASTPPAESAGTPAPPATPPATAPPASPPVVPPATAPAQPPPAQPPPVQPPPVQPPEAAPDPEATRRLPVQGDEGVGPEAPVAPVDSGSTQPMEPLAGPTTPPPASVPPAATARPAETAPPAEATRPAEPAPADTNATVMFTPEDIARLEEESAAVEDAADEADRLIGTLIRDKWKVLKRLGAGSFGTVYKVEDVTGGWIEALKILGVDRLTGAEAEEMRARFLREAQIMKRLGKDSKHIVGLSHVRRGHRGGPRLLPHGVRGGKQPRRRPGERRTLPRRPCRPARAPGVRRADGRARGFRAGRAP